MLPSCSSLVLMSHGANELGASCSEWSKTLLCGSEVLCSPVRASASPALPAARRLCTALGEMGLSCPEPCGCPWQARELEDGERGVTSRNQASAS